MPIIDPPQNQATIGTQVNQIGNPGFETGALPPWIQNLPSCTIYMASVHSGNYSVDVHGGGGELDQNTPPIPVSAITELSLWYSTTVGTGQVYIFHTDGSGDGPFSLSVLTGVWTKLDLTASLTPGKTVNKIRFYSGASGDSLFDDVKLLAPTPRSSLLLVYPPQS